jgi:hypothetical protein
MSAQHVRDTRAAYLAAQTEHRRHLELADPGSAEAVRKAQAAYHEARRARGQELLQRSPGAWSHAELGWALRQRISDERAAWLGLTAERIASEGFAGSEWRSAVRLVAHLELARRRAHRGNRPIVGQARLRRPLEWPRPGGRES